MVILLARTNDALFDLFSRKLATTVALLYCSLLQLLAFSLIRHAYHSLVFVQRLSVDLIKLFADVTLCLISITVLAHEALHSYSFLSLLVRLIFHILICSVKSTTRYWCDIVRFWRIFVLLLQALLHLRCRRLHALFTLLGNFLN